MQSGCEVCKQGTPSRVRHISCSSESIVPSKCWSAVFNIFALCCVSAIGRLSPACQAKFQDYAMRSDAMREPEASSQSKCRRRLHQNGASESCTAFCGPCRCLDLPDTLLEGKCFHAYLYFVCKVILTMGFSSPCCQSFFKLIAFRS